MTAPDPCLESPASLRTARWPHASKVATRRERRKSSMNRAIPANRLSQVWDDGEALRASYARALGFVLAIDNCRRGCLHCPAHGSSRAPQHMSLENLEDALRWWRDLRTQAGAETVCRTIHCWRVSDPLDYRAPRISARSDGTCIEVAELWR